MVPRTHPLHTRRYAAVALKILEAFPNATFHLYSEGSSQKYKVYCAKWTKRKCSWINGTTGTNMTDADVHEYYEGRALFPEFNQAPLNARWAREKKTIRTFVVRP